MHVSSKPASAIRRAGHSVAVLARELSATATSSAYLILAAGAFLGLSGSLRYALAGFEMGTFGLKGWILSGFACAIALAAALCSLWLGKRKQPLKPGWFIAFLVLASLGSRFILSCFVEPQWGTDYLRYWEYARELVETGRYGGFNAPYYSRSLFFPYPIIRIFGPEATHVLKLVNTLLLVIVQVLAYDILRRLRSHQAAQAASILLLTAPIPAYMTLIPSHDLWGTFFLAAAAWLVSIALDSRVRTAFVVPAALAAGVVSYIAEVQRGLGLVFCVAIAIAAALFLLGSYRRTSSGKPTSGRPWIPVLAAVLCMSAYAFSASYDSQVQLKSAQRPILGNMKFAANASGMGTGRSDWFARFRDRFIEKQASAEESRDFARSALLSAWSLHPGENVLRVTSQASRLYSLTYPRDWNWLLRKPKDLDPAARATLVFYADIFALVFGVLLLAACLRLSFFLRSPPLLTALCVMLIGISVVMLLVFENKPFNIFPIWFAGALMIGFALPSCAGEQSTRSVVATRPWHPGVSGLIAALLLPAALIAILSSTYSESSGRWLSRWNFSMSPTLPSEKAWQLELVEARPEAFDAEAYDPSTLGQAYIANAGGDGDRIQLRAGDAVTTMQFPVPVQHDSVLTLSTVVCTGDSDRRRLEFFIYSPPEEPSNGGSFSFDVEVNGLASRELSLPLQGRNFQRFIVGNAFSYNACHDLSFRIHARDAGTISGNSRGPMIEIWMPRLIH